MSQLPVLVLTPCEPDRPPDLDGPRGWTRVPADGESHYDPGPGVPQPGDHPAYWRTWALWNASGGAIAAGIRDTVGQLNMFHRGVPPGLVDRCLDDLRREVGSLVDAVRGAVDMDAPFVDGLPLDLDVAAGRYLRGLGPEGAKLGAKLEERNTVERFAVWASPMGVAPPIVHMLIDVLSADRWSRWEGKNPAIPALVMKRSLGTRPEAQPGLWRQHDTVDAALPVEVLRDLGNVTVQRLLRFLAREIARRATMGEERPEILEIEGGYSGLATLMGSRSKKAPDELRAALAGLEGATLRCDDVGGWSTLIVECRQTRRAVAGSWRSVLRIEAGPPLRPGFVFQYNARTGRAAKQLAPVWDLPPLDAVNPALQPAAARLDALALVALRELVRSPEDVERGVVIPWPALADAAELPRDCLGRLLDSWQNGEDRRWVRKGERWAPAVTPATEGVIRHLRAAGEKVAGGRRGAERRRDRVRGAQRGAGRK
jgi:hypothetical protein